jgi:hypothetical protein
LQKLRVGLSYQMIKITKTQMVPQLFEQRKCNMRSAVRYCNRPRRALAPECHNAESTVECVSSRTKTDASRNFYMTSLIAPYTYLAIRWKDLHNIVTRNR